MAATGPVTIGFHSDKPHRRRLLAGTALGLAMAAAPPGLANPGTGTVITGQVDISRTDTNNMVITQTGERGIINWDQFSIDKGQTVRFIHDKSSDVTLNRIQGSDRSIIDGKLDANGRIFLINPNGVLFGPDASINVHSLVVTTADITDDNFMAGKYVFDTPGTIVDAGIRNEGTITIADTGLAALMAPSVTNAKMIAAKVSTGGGGTVALGAGQTFVVDFQGDGLFGFEVTQGVDAQNFTATRPAALIANSGTIQADGGTVLLTATQAAAIVDNAISIGGLVQANSVTTREGRIQLQAGTGDISVTGTIRALGDQVGEQGGTVTMAGDSLTMLSDGLVDVTGSAGGGVITAGTTSITAPADTLRTIDLQAGSIIRSNGTNSAMAGQVSLSATQSIASHGAIVLRSNAGPGGSLTLTAPAVTLGSNLTLLDTEVLFNGAVTLASDVIITTGSGAVTFAGTVDGAQALNVNASGVTRFDQAVGGATPLQTLRTDSPGTTRLADVATTGQQLYRDGTVTLAGTRYTTVGNSFTTFADTRLEAAANNGTPGGVTIATSGGAITLGQVTGNARALFLGAGSGNILLSGFSGLSQFNMVGTGARTLNGGTYSFSAGGVQDLGDVGIQGTVDFGQSTRLGAVTLSDTAQIGSGAHTLTIASLAGARDLTLTGSAGGSILVEGAANVASLTTTGPAGFNITLAGSGSTSGKGSFAHAGQLAITKGFTFTGGADFTGMAGTVTLAGTIATTNQALNLGPVTLGGDTTLTTGTGITTLNGTVTATDAASKLTLAGDVTGTKVGIDVLTQADGSDVTGSLRFNRAVTLLADTTVQGSGDGTVFAGGITGDKKLTLSGPVTLASNVNIDSLVTRNGVVTLGTGKGALTITTTGDQQHQAAVTVAADVTLKAHQINLATNMTTMDTASLTLDGPVALIGATTITNEKGSVTVNGAITGNPALTMTGKTTLAGKNIDILGKLDLSGPVTIKGDLSVTAGSVRLGSGASGTGSLTITTTASPVHATDGVTALAGTVAMGKALSITADGGIALLGDKVALSAGTSLDLTGAIDAADVPIPVAPGPAAPADITPSLTLTAAMIKVASPVGAKGRVGSLATVGTADLRTVTTMGSQHYDGDTTLNGTLYKTSGGAFTVTGKATIAGTTGITTVTTAPDIGDIRFDGAVTGAGNLTLGGAGITTLMADVDLGALTINAGGSTQISSSKITTTGALVVTDAGVINRDLTVTAGSASFAGLSGVGSLTVTSPDTTFTGNVDLAAISTDAKGTTTLNAIMMKAGGDITLNDTVSLVGDATLTAKTVTLARTVDSGTDSIARDLTVEAKTAAHLQGDIGTTGVLRQLSVTGPATLGATGAKSFMTTTTDGQDFKGPVVLAADTMLKARNVTFAGTVDADKADARILTVNATETIFMGNIGTGARLSELVTGAGGVTRLGNGTDAMIVRTDKAIHLSDTVHLSADTMLSSAGTITIDGAITNDAPARHLIINAAGDTLLKAAVGTSTNRLASITSDAAIGTSAGRLTVTLDDATHGGEISGRDMHVLGPLTMHDKKTQLTGTTTATSGPIDFKGDLALKGTITASNGSVDIRGGVVLTGNSGLDAGTGTLTLAGAVDGGTGPWTLSLAGATVAARQTIGSGNALASLSVKAGTATLVDVDTIGAQTYTGAISLAGTRYRTRDAAFTITGPTLLGHTGTITVQASNAQAGDVTFAGTVNGAGALVINSGRTTSFGGAVGTVTPLTHLRTDAGGSTRISGGQVITKETQVWGDNVALAAATTLNATDITFAGTVSSSTNGPASLTVNGTRSVTFKDLVGVANDANLGRAVQPTAARADESQALRSLTVNSNQITLAPTRTQVIRTAGNLATGDQAGSAGRITFNGRVSIVEPVAGAGIRVLFDTTNDGATPSGVRGVSDVISLARGGDLLFTDMAAPDADVTWYLGSGRVAAPDGVTLPAIDLNSLRVLGTGGRADVTGSVAGFTGAVAAQRVEKARPRSNEYRLNDCAMGNPTCIVTGLPALPVPEAVNYPAFPEPVRLGDEDNPTISRGNEDLW